MFEPGTPSPGAEGVVITSAAVLWVFAGPFLIFAGATVVSGLVRLAQIWRRA